MDRQHAFICDICSAASYYSQWNAVQEDKDIAQGLNSYFQP